MNVQDVNIWIEIKISQKESWEFWGGGEWWVAEPGSALTQALFGALVDYSMPLPASLFSRRLLPACPKTVESKTSVGPNKKHQRRNVFTRQEQLSARLLRADMKISQLPAPQTSGQMKNLFCTISSIST